MTQLLWRCWWWWWQYWWWAAWKRQGRGNVWAADNSIVHPGKISTASPAPCLLACLADFSTNTDPNQKTDFGSFIKRNQRMGVPIPSPLKAAWVLRVIHDTTIFRRILKNWIFLKEKSATISHFQTSNSDSPSLPIYHTTGWFPLDVGHALNTKRHNVCAPTQKYTSQHHNVCASTRYHNSTLPPLPPSPE